MLPVSVCIIAKNEEKYIEECLHRLSGYDWEIVVVDTGSTDRTVEIAKSYTPNVYHFDWVNDFSAARNFSVSMAKNDYILVVDCDEYLVTNTETQNVISRLPNLIQGAQIGIIDRFSDTAQVAAGSSAPSEARVHEPIARFFHRKYVHYQGTIHEQLVAIQQSSLDFVHIPLSFDHVGYSTLDIKRAKAARNIAMLEAELFKNPHNPYVLFQLGQSYFGLNDYAHALPYFEEALTLDVNEQEDYVQTMVESYGYCLLYLKQYARALELEGIYSVFSKHADFVFLMGLIYMNNALFDRAVEEFLKATTISSHSVDGVNSYKAFYNVGVIYECLGDKEKAIDYYHKCRDYTPAANRLYELGSTLPILLYRDTGICCNLLNLFIEGLGNALEKNQQQIEYFDAESEGKDALTKYIGRHFKAIIGIQTYFFAIMLQDGSTNLHDLIHGPKYNIILDHPAWMKDEIKQAPKDYYLLLHDRNYISFAGQYYKNLAGCIHFPPAGMLPCTPYIPMEERKYDISFIGSYRNYRERLAVIRGYERTHRHVAAYYLKIMHQNPDYTGEKALEETLRHYGIPHDDEKFLELFYDMKQAYFCILLYYREKIIATLLDAGLEVHVFSETWKSCPLATHPGLICHPEVDAGDSLAIMQDSKLSLNIMSWHKDGLTERIFNSMLCRSVVLSDRTTALQEEFMDGQDMVLFSLDKLNDLPERVKALLADNAQLKKIALNGYEKALSKHTWKQRAEQLLKEL